MQHFLYPALFALFVWWFSTGAIIFLDQLPQRTFKYSIAGATAVLIASFWGMAASASDPSIKGAYCAFSCGLLAWGWQEITFYMGFVTGTRKAPCPEGCSGWKHFVHAIQTSLWHELAIIGAALVAVTVTWHQPNKIGLWTFMVLWWMHQSAKLNVFLGVRNLNEEFLPDHLAFLKSFLKKKPMNLLFPFSVTISSVICVVMWEHAVAPGASAFTQAGGTFIATMMALAILEHWFLVLPLPAAALWHWGLASKAKQRPFAVQVVAGFLGAGKTTYMRRLLAGPVQPGKTVVLVNDFAAVGVDGSLLSGQGADVVELPNGCICCSLKTDLSKQLQTIVGRFAPDRVLIEPSGVADLASLLRVLNGAELSKLVTGIDVVTILDAGAFLADFGRMEGHLQAQIIPAGKVIVNKADLVSPAMLRLVADTVRGLAPFADVLPARFGMTGEPILPVPASVRRTVPALHLVHDAEPAGAHSHAPHAQGERSGHGDAPGLGDAPGHGDALGHADHAGQAHSHDHAVHDADQGGDGHHHGAGHAHEHHEQHEGLGLASWSATLTGDCNADELQSVLEAVLQGEYGQVERMKGVTRAGAGWIRFDVAGGRSSMAAYAPSGADQSARVVAIGRHVDEEGLRAAFEACAA
jgi:putative photosynthetic complex assembly protein 2